MSAELTPTEQEIRWWEEAKDRYDEAEALVSWLEGYIERSDLPLRIGRYSPGIMETVSNLKQIRDSLAYAWGVDIKTAKETQ